MVSDLNANGRMQTEIDLNESEIDLNECEYRTLSQDELRSILYSE